MIDFAPSPAGDLEARARRDLVVAGLGATALLLIAGLVSMLSLRAEQAEERLLEQRNLAALGEMSAVLAHELKNPLASLKGHAQLLEEALPEEGRERAKANKIVGETKRLQVLINLVSNALEASTDEHTICLTLRAANEKLVAEVRAHVSGIDPKVRAHMFEPFRTTKARGAGLGLAICRHIVEAHGGTIDATDATGGGTVFTVVVPSQSET